MRYRKAKQLIDILVNRRKKIIYEMNNPYVSSDISGLPKSNNICTGAAGYIYRQAEIEERIDDQINTANDILINIMDILALLPLDSDERSVLELKYIDGYSDKEIIKIKYYGNRSTLSYHLTRGLDKLLQVDTVQQVISDYGNSY